ncbi:MAG: alpha/beta fold hydrolase [Acidimicrobiales bacterium]
MSDISRRVVPANGIEIEIAEAGDGPLVVLCHGFPELSYSWRHQLPALAAAGYHAVAPDQRGYGGTTAPEAVNDYDIVHLTDDMLGLLDALGEESAVFVGHDWGAPVVWTLALRAPERVRGVGALSVPYGPPRGQLPTTQLLEQVFGEVWFYMLYFQEPGIADADLGRDPATTMRRLFGSLAGDATPDQVASLLAKDDRGFVERLPEPGGLPGWVTQDEFDHFVATFTRTGFTGGLNWYRNLDRNWELTADLDGERVEVPALFIGGAADPATAMISPGRMDGWVTDLRVSTMLDGVGHWIQQERPDEINAALVEFLKGL